MSSNASDDDEIIAASDKEKAAALALIRSATVDGYVTSYKAPKSYQLKKILEQNGLAPSDFPGKGAFFSLDPIVAGGYAQAYRAGILEFRTPFRVIEKLITRGHIIPDGIEIDSFAVTPAGLPAFNASSSIRYIEPSSYEAYMKFNVH